ncbi:hypothetical protein EYF80_026917 [Liparis tanakae]|uniref:Uncharacterized protein n=1 Tax=Liparis tanakae TaxID=230148 RepID=A0A4Z2HDH1_9TELE|nr:hypothetical protein EYF80_026917 [Liparis tanakae]
MASIPLKEKDRLMLFTMHFPWQHFSPASITEKLEESMHRGTWGGSGRVSSGLYEFLSTARQTLTRAMSGSEPIRLQNLVIAAGPSSIPSSMLISRTWAPISTWVLAMLRASWTTDAR